MWGSGGSPIERSLNESGRCPELGEDQEGSADAKAKKNTAGTAASRGSVGSTSAGHSPGAPGWKPRAEEEEFRAFPTLHLGQLSRGNHRGMGQDGHL